MRFTTITALTTLAGLAAACPTPQPPVTNDPAYFSLLAIRSGSSIQYATFGAAKSSLFANLPAQNASCDACGVNTATFTLKDGTLNLYAASATPQTFYVDRSGMGQGKLGYTTGAQPTPKNAERTGWNIKDGYLYFNEAGLIACPNSIDGAWSVWVSAGIENPAGNSNCTPFAPKVQAIEKGRQIGCVYTE
ncbi:hypothetical protein ONS95_011529 [Cadophora gregata]|uniref:uncharacterized protein n=1 Tax=Cadophora gregata TaxID=51156 RepID=UPI0026DC57CB|nr:uncharacterized protein ONS95_011529 [Cadophora gregata]KAK0120121.1 hypothetical protein ONS95_011529 [Cadophora gregata]KAK0121149.1 hypothetical protein ONS96_011328 [Cadophora gregata f. sp. sojae]